MPYNLQSPRGILKPCTISNLKGWFARELKQVPSHAEKAVLRLVAANVEEFVRWPKEAVLLWAGCNRVPDAGKKQKYHEYPKHIREMAEAQRIRLDGRPNGPAIASFLLAGGKRPERFGSENDWSIHHLYSGKFPYPGREQTTHAVKDGHHFTQSAGLIAAHPVADALVEEFPFFAWLLRAKSFVRFGYDPDGVFSRHRDKYGFCGKQKCRIIRTRS